MLRSWQLLVCGVLVASSVRAQSNWIYVNADQGGSFDVYQDPWREEVEIHDPGHYIIWARDLDAGTEGQIKKVWVNPPTTGTVSVDVVFIKDGVELPGACDLYELDLSGASQSGVGYARLTGNYGNAVYGGTLRAGGAALLDVGGVVLKPVEVTGTVAQLTVSGAADSTAPITIGGNSGDFAMAGPMLADITIGGEQIGSMSLYNMLGDLSIGCNVTGTIETTQDLRSFHTGNVYNDIHIGRDLLGDSMVNGELRAELRIGGNLAAGQRLRINGAVTDAGSIGIDGNSVGDISIDDQLGGPITIGGDM